MPARRGGAAVPRARGGGAAVLRARGGGADVPRARRGGAAVPRARGGGAAIPRARGVELPSREPEGEEPRTQEPEGEKAEAPQQPLHMLLRGAQGRRTQVRRQEVPARLQRPLEWPQPPPPMQCLEPLTLEELELPLPEWPLSPPAVPEGPPAVPEGPPSPPVVPEGPRGSAQLAEGDELLFPPLPAEGDEPPFPPPPAEGDEPPFPPPPPEGALPPFPSPPPEVPPSRLLLEGPGSLPAFMGFEGPVPPLLKEPWGIRHQPRPPPPAEIAHPRDIRGLLGRGLGFKGGEFGRLRPPYFVRGGGVWQSRALPLEILAGKELNSPPCPG
ncbi:UNVERIFIED_CONTAM: hypothetical protein FKN15_078104 [Acipenser sinensis]